jgi:hypothetical protein
VLALHGGDVFRENIEMATVRRAILESTRKLLIAACAKTSKTAESFKVSKVDSSDDDRLLTEQLPSQIADDLYGE